MQRSQTVQLVRTLRAASRPSIRSMATGSPTPAVESGFPTGEEFIAKRAAIKDHAARMS